MAEQSECASRVSLVVSPPRAFGLDRHSRIGPSSKPGVTGGPAVGGFRLRSNRLIDTPSSRHTLQPALLQVPYGLHPVEDRHDLFVQPLAKAITFVPVGAAAQAEESGELFPS